MPLGPPGGGVDVASEVPPAIAGMDHDHRPLPPQRPDATQDGFEADRCSSVAHTSTTAPGCSWLPPPPWSPGFFESRLLLGAGRLGVPWPWRLRREVEQT